MRSLKLEEITNVHGLGCDSDYNYDKSSVSNLLDECKSTFVDGDAIAVMIAPSLVVYKLSRHI